MNKLKLILLFGILFISNKDINQVSAHRNLLTSHRTDRSSKPDLLGFSLNDDEAPVDTIQKSFDSQDSAIPLLGDQHNEALEAAIALSAIALPATSDTSSDHAPSEDFIPDYTFDLATLKGEGNAFPIRIGTTIAVENTIIQREFRFKIVEIDANKMRTDPQFTEVTDFALLESNKDFYPYEQFITAEYASHTIPGAPSHRAESIGTFEVTYPAHPASGVTYALISNHKPDPESKWRFRREIVFDPAPAPAHNCAPNVIRLKQGQRGNLNPFAISNKISIANVESGNYKPYTFTIRRFTPWLFKEYKELTTGTKLKHLLQKLENLKKHVPVSDRNRLKKLGDYQSTIHALNVIVDQGIIQRGEEITYHVPSQMRNVESGRYYGLFKKTAWFNGKLSSEAFVRKIIYVGEQEAAPADGEDYVTDFDIDDDAQVIADLREEPTQNGHSSDDASADDNGSAEAYQS